jgi:hypothetical protein
MTDLNHMCIVITGVLRRKPNDWRSIVILMEAIDQEREKLSGPVVRVNASHALLGLLLCTSPTEGPILYDLFSRTRRVAQ